MPMSDQWLETCPADVFFNGDPDVRRGERTPMPETCEACRWWRRLDLEDKWPIARVLGHVPKCRECRYEAADAIVDALGVCINPEQVVGWRLMPPDEGCELYEEEQ